LILLDLLLGIVYNFNYSGENMSRKSIFFIVFILLGFYSFSEIIGEVPIGIPVEYSDFDIELTISDNLIEEEIIIGNTTYISYIDRANTYEIRILQYKLADNDFDPDELNNVFIMSMLPIIFNLIEIEYALRNVIIYDPAGVRNETNGDYGFAAFIKYDERMETGFYAGYEYVIMNIFIKYDQGIVLKTIMMNDTKILETENFKNDFLIFKFRE
jgi:hypothetical protein